MGSGRISTIKHDVTSLSGKSMATSLAAKGKTRYPGTGYTLMPHRETSGKWRTGLDPDSAQVNSIRNAEEREATKKRIIEKRKRLEEKTGFDLGPESKFWDYTKYTDQDPAHVQPFKLIDGDNLFDFSNPLGEITFTWLAAHPRVASSLEAYNNGEYPSDTQFYVYDEDVENDRNYAKKQMINRAVVKLDSASPENRKKVARLMGLPVTEYTKESTVYNYIDTALKETEFKEGQFKGLSTVNLFLQFIEMKQNRLDVKDVVAQALNLNVLRKKENGKIYEGDYEVSPSEEELVNKLLDDDHQDELLALESKLKSKKLASL
jgi:hypothetical protein